MLNIINHFGSINQNQNEKPFYTHSVYISQKVGGLPWWTVDRNLPAKAGDTGFHLWSGKIPHARRQLSLCSTTPGPSLSRARARQQQKALAQH